MHFETLSAVLSADSPQTILRGLDREVCPELFALVGQTQPIKFHPEGDAFEHSLLVLGKVAAWTTDVNVRFAALFHDIGKGLTPREELPKHHNHDAKGAVLLKELNIPSSMKDIAVAVARWHMAVMSMKKVGKWLQCLKECEEVGALEALRLTVLADSGKDLRILHLEVAKAILMADELTQVSLIKEALSDI